MLRRVMVFYLINGYPVGKIAKLIGESRAKVRRYLKEGGIIVRPISGSYLRGRGSVCDSIARSGYVSFHGFAQVKSLEPISDQATALGVTEKSITRVYNAYRKLLGGLKTAGIVLPTTQMSGETVERATGEQS